MKRQRSFWMVVASGVLVGVWASQVGWGAEQRSEDTEERASAEPPAEHRRQTAVKEVLVGQSPSAEERRSLRISKDNRLVAFVTGKQGKRAVVLNGRPGKLYEAIVGNRVFFTTDGKHVGYAAKEGQEAFVVIDGVEQKHYDELDYFWVPSFAPRGDRHAYLARQDDRWFAVVDGVEGKKYDAVLDSDPRWSGDGRRVGYAARAGDTWFAVVDGKESKGYDEICRGSPAFSPDGEKVAFGAKDGEKWFVVIDGVEGKEYDKVSPPMFSADGKRVAYYAVQSGKDLCVVDGKELGGYDRIRRFRFAGLHGERTAYAGLRGKRWTAVVDGKRIGRYDKITQLFFSRNGEHYAFVGEKMRRGQRAYVIVVDGKPSPPYGGYSWPILISDGGRWAYVVRTGPKREWSVVVDGRVLGTYARQAEGARFARAVGDLTFSADGQAVAYWAYSNGRWTIFLDGRELRSFDIDRPLGNLVFSGPETLSALALRDGKLYRLEVSILAQES